MKLRQIVTCFALAVTLELVVVAIAAEAPKPAKAAAKGNATSPDEKTDTADDPCKWCTPCSPTPGSSCLKCCTTSVDPTAVAKIVRNHQVTFVSAKRVVIWLDGGQSYSIEPVAADVTHSFHSVADYVSDQHALFSAGVAGSSTPVQAGPPSPPRPPPPPPINHTAPRPPLPIPPRPSNRRPTPQPPPKQQAELATAGTIVGRLQTDGIVQSNWRLPKGTYTIVLTTLNAKPVAALVTQSGQWAMTFDNIFFLDSTAPISK